MTPKLGVFHDPNGSARKTDGLVWTTETLDSSREDFSRHRCTYRLNSGNWISDWPTLILHARPKLITSCSSTPSLPLAVKAYPGNLEQCSSLGKERSARCRSKVTDIAMSECLFWSKILNMNNLWCCVGRVGEWMATDHDLPRRELTWRLEIICFGCMSRVQ